MPFINRLIYTLILLTGHSVCVWAQGGATLEWGSPITFGDFESKPVEADTAAANISVTIVLGYSSGRDGDLTFRVFAAMDKDQSWIKEEYRNDEILKHEQGHFDIAHIFARKLGASLMGKRYTRNDVAKLSDVYDRYLVMMNDLQTKYDRETRGGLNPVAQSKWRMFIRRELAALER